MKTHLCQLYIPWMMVELLKSPADYYYIITYSQLHTIISILIQPLHLLSFMIFSSSFLTFSFLSSFL